MLRRASLHHADHALLPTKLELMVFVLEKDQPLQNYSLVKILNVSGRDQLQGARLLLLTDALSTVARQLGY